MAPQGDWDQEDWARGHPGMYKLNKHSMFLAWVAPGPPFENHYLRLASFLPKWPNSTLSLSTWTMATGTQPVSVLQSLNLETAVPTDPKFTSSYLGWTSATILGSGNAGVMSISCLPKCQLVELSVKLAISSGFTHQNWKFLGEGWTEFYFCHMKEKVGYTDGWCKQN